MCYEPASSTREAGASLPITFRPKRGQPRFRFVNGLLTYYVPADGPIRVQVGGGVVQDSLEFLDGDDTRFQIAINSGFIIPAGVEGTGGETGDTRTDRLAADEEDTGFKIGERVEALRGASIEEAVVVGFARVAGNLRVVVRHLKSVDELFIPEALAFG